MRSLFHFFSSAISLSLGFWKLVERQGGVPGVRDAVGHRLILFSPVDHDFTVWFHLAIDADADGLFGDDVLHD